MMADWDAAQGLLRTGQNLTRTTHTPTNITCYSDICKMRMYPDRIFDRMAYILREQKLPALLKVNHPSHGGLNYKDFDQFPASAQVFCLSFAYGRIPFDFPKMSESIGKRAFGDAAEQCHVQGMSPSKDAAHKKLLLHAQSVVDQNLSYDTVPAEIY
jgi:hypothetical protein